MGERGVGPVEERGVARLLLGWGAMILFLLIAGGFVVAFTFSVSVDGHSMNPTLRDNDRLVWNVLARHDIHRFDLVQAVTPDINKTHIVKRVIGLPGDRVAIAPFRAGREPKVYLRPAGSSQIYRVTNATWPSQVGTDTSPCCNANGSNSGRMHWATVPQGSYWLMGDNYGGSTDSRVFGFARADTVGGTLGFRIWPLSRFGPVPNHVALTPVRHAP